MFNLLNISVSYVFLVVFIAENILGIALSHVRGLSLTNLSIYLLLMVLAFNIAYRKKYVYRNNINLYLLLMVILLFTSIPIKILLDEIPTGSPLADILAIKRWIDPWILFIFFSNIIENRQIGRQVTMGLLVVLALSIVLTLLAIFNIAVIGNVVSYRGRYAGFTEPNQYAALLVLFLPLTISYMVLEKVNFKKAIFGVIGFASLICLFYTGSRGGLVAFLISMALYSVLLSRHKILSRGLVKVFVVVIPLALILSYTLSPAKFDNIFQQRIRPGHGEDIKQYTSGRTFIWEKGLLLFLESPVYGHGLNSFAPLFYDRFNVRIVSHNDYLNYLVNFGIIGLFLFVFIFFKIFQYVFSSLKQSTDISDSIFYISYLSGLAGYAVALFGVNLYNPVRIMFWVFTAVVYRHAALAHSLEQSRSEPSVSEVSRLQKISG